MKMKHPGRHLRITAQVIVKVVEGLKAGQWDWVAAGNAGISRRSFYRWMALAEEGDPRYTAFASAVHQAHTLARGNAEARVYIENPLAWLRLGPGRPKPDAPGWTDAIEVTDKVDEQLTIVQIKALLAQIQDDKAADPGAQKLLNPPDDEEQDE